MAGKDNWHPRDYASLADVRAELDRFENAHSSGQLRSTGKWSAAENLDHCGRWFKGAIDGIDFDLPVTFKVLGRVMIKPLIGKFKARPGLKQPKTALTQMDPQPGVTVEEGLALMRAQLDRLDAGEKMTKDSPLLGRMSHEKWLKVQLDHCRMHFGFIQCDTVGA